MAEAALKQDDEEIVVAIETETEDKTDPKRNPDGTFAKAEPVEPADDLAEQFATLKTENERNVQRANDEARRRTEAERAATQAREEAASARGEAIESHVTTVESGLEAARAEADSAEREYIAAVETGDAAKQAQAQRKIARAEAKIGRLDEAKAELDIRRTKAEPEPRRQQQIERPRQADDPVEAYVQNRSEPTANWLRAHPDFITDPRKNAKLTAAHYDATGEGIDVDSKEYFEHVEKFIGLTNGAKVNGKEPAPKRKAAPVAPGAATGGGTNGGGRQVTLTRGEAAAATDGSLVWNYSDTSGQNRFKKGDPIGVQEFARRKLEMTKQGAYDRTYTEQ